MVAARTNWIGVIYGLSLSYFGAYQLFKLPPALPLLLERYGYDRALAGGFMSVYALAGLLTSLYLGRLIDRQGIAKPVLGALGLMVVGNMMALVAPGSGLLMLAARGFEGVAFAVLAIAGPVLANREAGLRHLPLVIGLTAAWIPFGQTVAALLAPQAFALYGWQLLWLLAMAGSLAMAAWTLALARGPAIDLKPTASEADRVGLAATSVQRGALILAGGIFMIWSGQYFAAMTWLPQYLIETQALDLDLALAAYLLPVLVLALFNVITGMLLRAGVPLGPLLLAALLSQVAVWWLLPSGEGLTGLVLLIVYGIGAGICPACLFAMPNAIVGRRNAASAFGIIMTGRNVGVFVGPILIAQIFKMTGAWDSAAPVFAGLTAVSLLFGFALSLCLRRLAYGTRR